MIPAVDLSVHRHDYPLSAEQALVLLDGPIGIYYTSYASFHDKQWRLDLRQKCIELAWDHLLKMHSEMGIERLHLAMGNRKVPYPHTELITTSREWWDKGYYFLRDYGRSHGHGERDIGIGQPIYSMTVEYKFFSTLEEGEYDTQSGQRIGAPYRYIAG